VIKAELSTSLLQSSESHDPDELMLKKHFSLLSLSTIVLLLQYYSTKISLHLHFYFRIIWWIESSKEQHLSEIESFGNIKHYRSKVWV